MLTGVCLIAIYTAAITSAITVSSVDSDCKNPQGKHVSRLFYVVLFCFYIIVEETLVIFS